MRYSCIIAGFLLGSGVLGCTTVWEPSPDFAYNVWIEGPFCQDQQAEVEGAVRDWNKATQKFVKLSLVDNDNYDNLITVKATTLAILKSKTTAKEPIGVDWFEGGSNNLIEMPVDNPLLLFHSVVRHEMGHALGLLHTGEGTLMCASSHCSSQEITCADVEQFCQVWGCEARYLPICQK